MILGGIFAFGGGWLLDKYGPRIVISLMGFLTCLSLLLTSLAGSAWQLFITYSFLLPIGTSSTYVIIMTMVSRWFDKRRGLALGIAGSGEGLGTVYMAPMATYLICNFGWRITYSVIGVMACIIVIPLSILLKGYPQEIDTLPHEIKTNPSDNHIHIQSACISLSGALKTRGFWILAFIWSIYGSCTIFSLIHIVPHATDIGISAGKAATILSLLGGASVIGRVITGIALDRISKKVAVIICILLQTVAFAWLLWSDELWAFYLFAVVFGFSIGGMGPSIAALVGETFGLGKFSVILGTLEIGYGVGAAIGVALGGFFFDICNSYFIAFLFGVIATLVAAFLATTATNS